MSTSDPAAADALLEECLDELDAAIQKLERFPQAVLAFALRAQLEGLLQVLCERGEITPAELEEFARGLGQREDADGERPEETTQRGPVLP